jgi:endonuclease/exonuclease/phosphatase family metal-dependent hydrolase
MPKIIILFMSAIWGAAVLAQDELNVMTFNIRYDNPADSLNAWPYRKDKAVSQILFHKVQLLGVQEALHHQLEELKHGLSSYKYAGVGRADGKEKGEFSAIFFDTTRLQLLQTHTFWLAEQTDIGGKKGWDAAIERIVTWAKFRDKKTKKVFYHFNTHFDHIGKVARRESARLLLQKVKEIAGTAYCIITGDFNATPDDEPIQLILDKKNPDRLINTREMSLQKPYGPLGTFNAFTNKETRDKPIDYIFIKNNPKVLQHATLSQTWEGRFSSDHFPVYAVLKLN